MTLSLATIARNNSGNAIVDLIDSGSLQPNGYIEIRTGAKPATPQTAASGTLLSTLRFSNPAFASFSNGQSTANTIAQDPAIAANGVASWFRIYNRDGDAILDGEVTAVGDGGDIEFDNINFIQNG